MRIVIAGAGEVGTHLARMLSKENHDIILLDDDAERLSRIDKELDVLTINGSAHSFHDIRKTIQGRTDLFVAVTTGEERNILACSIAHSLGAARTVARINNSEYMQESFRDKITRMGIDELVYPEDLAANYIVSSIKLTGARHRIEFANGNLVLLAIKIRMNAPIVNRTLQEISYSAGGLFAVAIKRNRQTIIPGGKDYIRDGDIVFFVTSRLNQEKVFELCGKELFDIKTILFLGGSRIAQKTIEKLGSGYHVKIIENDRQRCEYLADRFDNALVISGDGRDIELLKEEGLERMDAFVATTGSSETNILSCHLAKTYNVRRTAAQIENFALMGIAEGMNIGSIINKKLIAASSIYRFTLKGDISTFNSIPGSDAEVIEFMVKPGTRITRGMLKDLDFPADAKIGGIIRGDDAFLANGNSEFAEGDKVVVFTLPAAVKKLERFFT